MQTAVYNINYSDLKNLVKTYFAIHLYTNSSHKTEDQTPPFELTHHPEKTVVKPSSVMNAQIIQWVVILGNV